MKYIAMITYANWTSYGRTLFEGLSVRHIKNMDTVSVKTDNPNKYDGFIYCEEKDIEAALVIVNSVISQYEGFFRILPAPIDIDFLPWKEIAIHNNICQSKDINDFIPEAIRAVKENKEITLYDFLRRYEEVVAQDTEIPVWSRDKTYIQARENEAGEKTAYDH